jgi:ScpA/B protein.
MDEISKRLNSEEPEEEIQKVWSRIVELKEDQCFMEDIWGHTVEDKSMFFVYCMFLYRNGKITLNQEEPFGSIRIKRMENA